MQVWSQSNAHPNSDCLGYRNATANTIPDTKRYSKPNGYPNVHTCFDRHSNSDSDAERYFNTQPCHRV